MIFADRFLKFDELKQWLFDLQAKYPNLLSITIYGQSYESRDLMLVNITDISTGDHSMKPAHWIDANIHATELTAGVAACYLIFKLVNEFSNGNKTVVDLLKTRTMYIVPRVNPDGVEAALNDIPRYLRSSVKKWPWKDHYICPG